MKSGFQNKLCVELKDGTDDVWIFNQVLLYWSELFGLIEIPIGFESDFCTVPRVPIAYRLWGGRNHREGALHDFSFRIDSKPNLGFMDCNNLFLEAMASRDVRFWIRYPMYAGVCTGGIFHYHKRRVRDSL